MGQAFVRVGLTLSPDAAILSSCCIAPFQTSRSGRTKSGANHQARSFAHWLLVLVGNILSPFRMKIRMKSRVGLFYEMLECGNR